MAKKTDKPATKATLKKDVPVKWQDRFLEMFATSLNVALAAESAGINRATAYKERDKNPEFARAWAEAKSAAIERLEAAAYDRARNMSDTLLIFLLKAHKPDIYRENIQQSHTGGVEVVVKHVQTTKTN